MTSSLIPNTANYDLRLQLQACQSRSRRNGKVARLPATIRDQINHMIDNGLIYKQIILNLGSAGQHLSEDNLSNWRRGGYQDYLNAQAINTRALVETEAVADIVRERGFPSTAKLQQVCGQVLLLKYLHTVLQHGEHSARESIKRNPAKLITLINACSNMANTNIALEQNRWKPQPPPHPPSPPEPNRTSKILFQPPVFRSNR